MTQKKKKKRKKEKNKCRQLGKNVGFLNVLKFKRLET